MFLRKLQAANPELVAGAVRLYGKGKIQANSYVIDLDAIEENAGILAAEAKKQGLTAFAMTKQIGRNPEVAKRIARAGIQKFVTVDPWEALVLAEAGLALGNVGHLVQIPDAMMERLVGCRPEVITVFSYEKALTVNRAAEKAGRIQPVILKVTAAGDMLYEGQQGGVEEGAWSEITAAILKLPYIKLVGLTAFPCFLFDEKQGEIREMPNMETVRRAKRRLEAEFGISLPHINTPSANTTASMRLIAEAGGTVCEPGHALTGTTPLHAVSEQPERIALLYITEVSHLFKGKAYTFFGGHYRRSHMLELAVFSKDGKAKGIFPADAMDAESIDYYGSFPASEEIGVGDICVYAFRTQIFTTRSQVVLLEGLAEGKVQMTGIYDSQGRRLE